MEKEGARRRCGDEGMGGRVGDDGSTGIQDGSSEMMGRGRRRAAGGMKTAIGGKFGSEIRNWIGDAKLEVQSGLEWAYRRLQSGQRLARAVSGGAELLFFCGFCGFCMFSAQWNCCCRNSTGKQEDAVESRPTNPRIPIINFLISFIDASPSAARCPLARSHSPTGRAGPASTFRIASAPASHPPS